jgi:hypothetical protein
MFLRISASFKIENNNETKEGAERFLERSEIFTISTQETPQRIWASVKPLILQKHSGTIRVTILKTKNSAFGAQSIFVFLVILKINSIPFL